LNKHTEHLIRVDNPLGGFMKRQQLQHLLGSLLITSCAGFSSFSYAGPLNLAASPLFVTTSVPPLTMLVMGRDHKLYYEAYNDASDLNDDGIVDVGYQGYHTSANISKNVDYYGYFNSYVCYDYNSTTGLFEPKSAKSAADILAKDKTCAGGAAGSWSGDFLNYVTTARMDAVRKVFYGGYRSTDTTSKTVLERTHIPQDAHAWGKEYASLARDGYDISNYTPLSAPDAGKYHLFANVSLSSTTSPYGSNAGTPRLRVLNNTKHRVWEWLSKERPVAGAHCIDGLNGPEVACSVSASSWSIVPGSAFSNLTRKVYNISGYGTNPIDASQFDTLESNYAIASKKYGEDTPSQINGSGNPFGSNDNYMTIFEGELTVPTSGSWKFSVDGDDAIDFWIDHDRDGTLEHYTGWYGPHGASSSTSSLNSHAGSSLLLTAGIKYDIKFRHEEASGGDSYYLYWSETTPSSSIADYIVRVEVCTSVDRNVNHETNSCVPYPNGEYKPTGLLHDFGENDSMMFGLLTGSYENNLDGGVLRKAVSSFKNEIDLNTGQFNSATNGIISTLNKLRTVNYNDSGYSYSCGWIENRPIKNKECDMWGNPIAEMMYESLRYFAGKSAPTADFDIPNSGNNDAALGLPKASWDDPYDPNTGYDECAKPFQVVISDINPSYDSDKVPGAHSSFGSTFSGDISGLNVSTLADTITEGEGNIKGKKFFIGQSGTTYDNAPTAKTVDSLASVRGMAPEEPTKLGSYYSASLAYYGFINDIHNRAGKQNLQTFAVALASPLPTIEIDPDNNPATLNSVILVPFAKSPGQGSMYNTGFFPTNQIVDFYVESLTPTTGSFLINFEDVEQGADHDMDAIVRYTYTVNNDGTITIDVDSVYAAGGIDQHMGYVISGTTKDGVYLEVRDIGSRGHVFSLDTPPGVWAGDPRGTTKLGLNASRTFTPNAAGGSAGFLKDPLWYAAKWGGFIEKGTGNNKPDQLSEWASKSMNDPDPNPDNYFLVTNALSLKERMKAAFDEILARSGSASTVAATSGSLRSDTLLFQASFNSDGWAGQVSAIEFGSGTQGATNWEFSEQVRKQLARTNGHDANREIITSTSSGTGIPFRFPADYSSPAADELAADQITALLAGITTDHQNYGDDLINYLRGESSEEGATGTTRQFRERESNGLHQPVGDIVNSDPLYILQPGFFYPDKWPTTLNGAAASSPENSAPKKYSDFRADLKNRAPMLAVGANDGMLHIMNAYANDNVISDGGEEILAYVPSVLYSKLPALANPNYTHEYYVDGRTTYADAFFTGDSKWHTTLVGGLNAGGQGIYALDVTDPKGITGAYPTFDESNADDLLLWEFTDADDADLGFTFGRPTIVRLSNGQWGAIFGNGYNNTFADGTSSATGNAAIYIVNIETGALISKFDTEQGMLQDPEGATRPNGMSEVTVVDVDQDFVADYLYAGDLFGNVWKVDIRSTNANNWDFAFSKSGKPAPLFVAKSAAGNELPITQRLIVRSHPEFKGTDNYLIAFGTGKYFETTDNIASGQETQSFFGIWDNGSNTFTRSDLLLQTITELTSTETPPREFREVSTNKIRWKDEVDATGTVTAGKHGGWVLDLLDSSASPLNNKGERSVTNAVFRDNKIIFTTLIPSTDPCDSGGSSWLMVIDSEDGSATGSPFFDETNDKKFDNDDLIDIDGDGKGDILLSGKKHDSGILSGTTFVETNDGGIAINSSTDWTSGAGSNASIEFTQQLYRANKRLFWRELH
jgi:type IV pilus assembly protein PilY1